MKHLFTLTLLAALCFSQSDLTGLKALGAPLNPKVDIRWNRYYDFDAITKIADRITAAYPHLVKKEVLGKSHEGNDVILLKITDYSKGSDETKPAMYIDGNIHSNEIQGSEVVLYTAWFVTENFSSNEWIRNLLKEKALYLVPSINPDARNWYMHKANSSGSPRAGMIPTDNDLDGEVNEDGPDDLNGDGHITQMRKKNPNGRWKVHEKYPNLMVRAADDEVGTHDLYFTEGFDNDGDGRINEDGKGYYDYDPNRDWAMQWEPKYIQRGARRYPFSLPISKLIENFVKAHPNIAGAQSFHNSGGMILRGPGKAKDKYDRSDLRTFDYIGRIGEQILPDYNYYVVWKDLYEVYGGELDWFYGNMGITTYSNELWTWKNMFRYNDKNKGKLGSSRVQSHKFDQWLLFGEAFSPWKKVKHPQLGDVEIGGFKKNFGRVPPSFLLEEECHRNMAFTLFHAHHMPSLRIADVKTRKMASGIYEVTVTVANDRIIPTRLNHDVKNSLTAPDVLELKGDGAVLSSMHIVNETAGTHREQVRNPSKLEIATIGGVSTVKVRFLVDDNGDYTLTLKSKKGGTVTKKFDF